MPEESNLELSIDPRTGITVLAEGADVYVKDELGKTHSGLIIAVHPGPETQYTVLLTCNGTEQEVTVPETGLLARATAEWDL